MSKPLKEKLRRLQCHFTWDLEDKDKVNVRHIQQTLAVHLKQEGLLGPRVAYLTTKAYVCYLEGGFKEALASLKEAEKVLRQDHAGSFSRQVLVAYGNYAWIYYHLTDYDRVDIYLDRIQAICQSLSSPEPYSALIPETYAQKGWSLLAVGHRNGEQAKECFQKALEQHESSEELQEGLILSTAALLSHCWEGNFEEECQRLLEELILRQPQNNEAKVYLASVLKFKDYERAEHLADDVVQNCLNPEVLRKATKLYRFHSRFQAFSILKKAIALEPDYYLLHYDLGLLYMDQVRFRPALSEEERAQVVKDGIESFKRALEGNPYSVYSRLKLATLYGERAPRYAEEIFLNLMEELPMTSRRCQRAIYLHWGDFLLNKRKQEEEALKAYEACCNVQDSHPLEQKHLVERLRGLARWFQQEGKTERVEATFSLLRAIGVKCPETWRPPANREKGLALPSQECP